MTSKTQTYFSFSSFPVYLTLCPHSLFLESPVLELKSSYEALLWVKPKLGHHIHKVISKINYGNISKILNTFSSTLFMLNILEVLMLAILGGGDGREYSDKMNTIMEALSGWKCRMPTDKAALNFGEIKDASQKFLVNWALLKAHTSEGRISKKGHKKNEKAA